MPIFFTTISPSYQFGATNKFLSLGLELKNISSSEGYNGFGLGGFAGFSYNGQRGFLFKVRLGATGWTSEEDNSYYQFAGQNRIVPMGSISAGFSFGTPL